ncbi:BID domain-containing T4SS effector [Bartonella gliris]|uniref:BID domain-containing T4SS effector n=1 Tax=Bartonella gliris TaxID=3004109 RepID=UPI00295E4FEA|nr:BID domain-containing T4SS effector [Bartonella gliris]
MKKNHPSHSSQTNPKALYTKVNKPNRGARPQNPEEEVVYADVSVRSRGHHPQRQEQTDYVRVTPQQRAQASLSNNELAEKTARDLKVQAYQEEIAYWCVCIFGSSRVLQKQIEDILKKPTVGEQLAQDVATNPRSFHKLVGYNICGLKTIERKEAEDGLLYLYNAINGYTNAVKQTRERLLQTPCAEEKRQALQQEKAQKLHKEKDVQHDHSQDTQAPKMPRKKVTFAI